MTDCIEVLAKVIRRNCEHLGTELSMREIEHLPVSQFSRLWSQHDAACLL